MAKGKHEGTEIKERNGSYYCRIMLGYKPDGKPNRVSITAPTKRELKLKKDELVRNYNMGLSDAGSKIKLGEWCKQVYEQYKKPTVKQSSYERYEGQIKNHIIGSDIDRPLAKLTSIDIQTFLNNKAKNLSTETVVKLKNIISFSLSKARANKLLIFNPVEDVDTPNGSEENLRPAVFYNDAEYKLIVEHLLNREKNIRLKAMIYMDLHTGLRIGELLALTDDDIDYNKKFVKVNKSVKRLNADGTDTKTSLQIGTPKTKRSFRNVPLSDEVIKLLKEWQICKAKTKLLCGKAYKDSGLLFVTDQGGPLDPRNVSRAFERLLKRIGIEKGTFHSLRHTFATRLNKAGVRDVVAAEILGHTVAMYLETYNHTEEDEKTNAIELLMSRA